MGIPTLMLMMETLHISETLFSTWLSCSWSWQDFTAFIHCESFKFYVIFWLLSSCNSTHSTFILTLSLHYTTMALHNLKIYSHNTDQKSIWFMWFHYVIGEDNTTFIDHLQFCLWSKHGITGRCTVSVCAAFNNHQLKRPLFMVKAMGGYPNIIHL
jgi:hypothetical protein